MGAAGYVTIYREDEVRRVYAEMWPGHSIDQDWWYMRRDIDGDRVTVDLDGTRYLVDYADDQGFHEGTHSSCWFADDAAQARVRDVLRRVRGVTTEVWT